mmetsp:Transcript_2067/g.3282  ORF Transcript_2067/g.3282 Transcript_2067/m.3282 type:complete len:208 (+) Transcript_2067:385-1008(+)
MMNWMDTSVNHELSCNLSTRAESHDWYIWSKGSNQSRQNSMRSQDNDCSSVALFGSGHGCLGNCSIYTIISTLSLALHEPFPSHKIWHRHCRPGEALGTCNDFIHSLNNLHWIFALGCFTRKHNTISSVVYSISYVRDFGPGWSGIFRHAFQHLGSNDDRLSGCVTSCYHFFLCISDLLNRNFYTQITTCNHDSVRLFQNIIKVIQS